MLLLLVGNSPQEMQKVTQKLQGEAAASSGLLGGVFSLFGGGGGGGGSSPAPKPLASLSRQPSTSTISGGGPAGLRFDEPDDDDRVHSLNPFAS